MTRDSVKYLKLAWIIIAVEGAFNVGVDVDAMKKFVTIGDFVQYIEKTGK